MGYKRFHYTHWGRNSTFKIILLHGIGESSNIWFQLAPLLANKYEVIALDLRGHGGTPWDTEGDYSLNSYIDDIQLIISHWNHPTVMIGHGIGSEILIKVSENFSSLVKSNFILMNLKSAENNKSLIENLSVISNELEQNIYEENFRLWSKIYKDLTWATSSGRISKCDPKVLDVISKDKSIDISKEIRSKTFHIKLSDLNLRIQNSDFNSDDYRTKLSFINQKWYHISHPKILSEHILKKMTKINLS